ncbi:MAG: FtsH protease activity modulator HflK [Gammaproteobacteria bacterium]|nr:FtsH protease activity modulator HflK [Gammaproteobacteria bacterium]
MAWNEPGGSNGKDPWGGGNKGQEPPDLDEVIRKLQQKLSKLFGGATKRPSGLHRASNDEGGGDNGSSNASSGGSGEAMAKGGAMVVIGLLLVVWIVSGFYIVEEGFRGVITRFGAYVQSSEPGLHWRPRFVDGINQVDVSGVRSAKLGYEADEALMLTQDENIIDIRFDVQYQIKPDPDAARDYLFNVRDPDETLRQATASAVREVIGKSTMDFIITEGRSTVALDSQRLLQETLDTYESGLVVIQLTMQSAAAPQQVKKAFDDVVEAREDAERYKNEAETYANDILPKARGAAARLIQEAEGYKDAVIAAADGESARFAKVLVEYEKAPEVTRQRLYIDAMESVLQNSSKVIVDNNSSNNLLYLPLDRIRAERTFDAVGSEQADSGRTTSSTNTPLRGSRQSDLRNQDDLRNRGVR